MAFPFFLIPMAVQAIQAGIQGGKAKKSLAESNRLDSQIPLDDPEQRGYLNKLARQERHYRAGTDPNTALANRLAQQSGAQAQSNLVRAGGPGIVQNILSSQNVTNRGLAANAAQAAGMADNMLGMQGQLTNLMASRRYDRQRYRRDLNLMQGTQHQQNANNLVSSLYSTLGTTAGNMSGGGGFGGGGAKVASGNQMNQVPPMNVGQASFAPPMYENQTPGVGGSVYRDPYTIPSAALDQNLSKYGQ